MTEVGSRISQWIAQEILYEEGLTSFTEETPLLGSIIDSMGIVSLLVFIQEEFNVVIDDVDVNPDNFRDLATIERFVTEKMRSRSQAEVAGGDR